MMKTRQGFTLAELVIAIFIFSFIVMSLATIYSTSSRNMLQNYRVNVIKSSVGVAMRAVQNNLSVSTRVDRPAYGAADNVLNFATNVDQVTGCYPVGPGSAAWHHFCIAPDPAQPGLNALYYHTATIPGGTGCAVTPASVWTAAYPAGCGLGQGGTVTVLMQAASPNPVFFSRRPTEIVLVNGVATVTQGVRSTDAVRVMLRSFWSASARGFGKGQRDVDFTLDTVIKVNKSAW